MKNFKNVFKISLLSLCLGGTMLTSCKKDDADTIAPTITLNGNSTVYVQKGQPYSDAGAVGSDNVDGTITVTATGATTVNTAVVATYTITYSGKDKAGNAASEQKRIVYVVEFNNVLFDVHDVLTSTDTALNGPYDYVATTTTSTSTNNKLTIANFGGLGTSVYFDCTWAGDKMTLNGSLTITVPGTSTTATGAVTGTGTISGANANKLSVNYKIIWTGGYTSTDNGAATYTRK